MIQPIILCGGSGTRLWPLSRKSFPKQFVPLIGGKSLLELTLLRVVALAEGSTHGVICVGAEEHRFLLAENMHSAGIDGAIILEPIARNTAAAMALAALHAEENAQLLFCPADHHIPDTGSFTSMVRKGADAAAAGLIVTFGVTPSVPSTAYGYIECGAPRADGTWTVASFIEKPEHERAQALLLERHVLWNAGIFLCTAGTLLAALEQHAPDILARCRQAMAGAISDGIFVRPNLKSFAACRSESIDYAVMERHTGGAVVLPFEGAWSDVGSWNNVAELTDPDENDNRIAGDGFAIGARNTFIHAPHRPVLALGTEDLLIIDTPDALLVAAKSSAEQVKNVVALLEANERIQGSLHRKVARPWGWYDSIETGERFQVKLISVKPGSSLSLQKHHHRAEHWVVVKGTAEVTCGEDVFLLSENQSTFIPLGEVHRLHNPGKTALEMIEIQSGSYLGEDDIVRFDDVYGRVSPLRAARKLA